jgi:glycosyltransferase involved in cell wall biosynthesis
MMGGNPRVSVGLPVKDGEDYLAEAIESIVAQTFENFELIIGDNASTDRTEDICRTYAAMDNRIRYLRHPQNIGAHPNFNGLFKASRSEYFKWAAHDDVLHPDFLLRCIEALDGDPTVVLSYPWTVLIDEEGRPIKPEEARPQLASPKPRTRFTEALRDIATYPIFGVIRSEVLRKTPLLGPYPGSDRVLMCELSLYGPCHEVPEALFFNRDHPKRYSRVYDYLKTGSSVAWFDPASEEKIKFPIWRQWGEYFRAIGRPDIPLTEKLLCYLAMMGWPARPYRLMGLLLDLVTAGRRFLPSRPRVPG